jgi:hypothetical protein
VAAPGQGKDAFVKRAKEIGVEYVPDRFPWCSGTCSASRATASAPRSRNGTAPSLAAPRPERDPGGRAHIVFRIADEQGLLLLDLKDLRALLQLVAENAKELTTTYGNVSKATVGAIQRQLLVLENQGGEAFLGEPRWTSAT